MTPRAGAPSPRHRFALFFFVSGFCGLLYEVVWVRLGMANFGVTTPIVSLFVSVFMAGLGLGSWAAGAWMRRAERDARLDPLLLYALVELAIGASALLVPRELEVARAAIAAHESDLALASGRYFAIAGGWISTILLPWCLCMGATYPLAMAALRRFDAARTDAFSLLYVANVAGAIVGALAPAFVLVELFGFRTTLAIGCAGNLMVCLLALAMRRAMPAAGPAREAESVVPRAMDPALGGGTILLLLGATGLLSLAMEMVWIRQFTAFMGTEVYTFAWILGCYLVGTEAGSALYRRRLARHGAEHVSPAWLLLGVAALLPLAANDPALPLGAYLRVALGVMPVSAVLGFVTPQLVDQYSRGAPDRAGRAYAVNVLGCIAGPLLASFGLLPALGERATLIVLAAPLFALPLLLMRGARIGAALSLAVGAGLVAFTRDFYANYPAGVIRRDYAATTMAIGEGMDKRLVVNGVNLTSLSMITKYMAHLPLAHLDEPPRKVLVICFGMGTTFRALRSWGADTTAVELLPSVAQLFDYFHDDAPAVLAAPGAHLIVDDGRLFLEKSKQQFDAITIDPPPPTTGAGVSLLYSKQFYAVLKPRLAPNGILQQWLYADVDPPAIVAVSKAIRASFKYVVAYRALNDDGIHFLASDTPIPQLDAAALAAKLPSAARADFLEWLPAGATVEEAFGALLARPLALDGLEQRYPLMGAMDDDQPVNEYHLLRDFAAARQ